MQLNILHWEQAGLFTGINSCILRHFDKYYMHGFLFLFLT